MEHFELLNLTDLKAMAQGEEANTPLVLHWDGSEEEPFQTTAVKILELIEAGFFTEEKFEESANCATLEAYQKDLEENKGY